MPSSPSPPAPDKLVIRPSPLSRFPRPRSRRAWIAFLASLVLLALLIAWLLSRATPSWYAPLSASDNRVIDDAYTAQSKLLEIHNALQRTPLGDQRWTITQDELNAFLAVNFPSSPAHAGAAAPPLVSDPFVRLTPGLVTIGVRTTRVSSANPNGGVVSVSFVVDSTTAPDGSPIGHIRVASAAVGRLPIPASIVQSKIRALAPTIITLANDAITRQFSGSTTRSPARIPDIETAIHAIVDGQPFPLRFTADRRTVLIHEIRVDNGALSITFSPPTPAAVRPRPLH
ncbi:MAG TPA: hypothetical protein VHQ47_02190 [Phycisphaerae bacterium]|nr:hypothetical protein [Phycisphaerae bacterium]